MRPAAWWGRLTASQRASEAVYLNQSVKELRRTFTDFDASDGFDLRHIETWSAAKAKKVRDHAQYLHALQSRPHKIFRPRSKKSRKAILHHTRQFAKKQKAFLVHVAVPEKTSLRVTKSGRLEEIRHTPNFDFVKRYYTFLEMTGEQPITFEDMVDATKQMLPHMPNGMYSLFTPIGTILSPTKKKNLILTIQQVFIEGDSGSAETPQMILGFMGHGTRRESEIHLRAVERYRQDRIKDREEKAKKRRRLIRRFYGAPKRKK